jgi:hypothetical protein
MKNPIEDYLPEAFTVEFDAYFEQDLPSGNVYRLLFTMQKSKKQD